MRRGHINYYLRFSFSRAKDYGLDSEYHEGDAFMVMELKPFEEGINDQFALTSSTMQSA